MVVVSVILILWQQEDVGDRTRFSFHKHWRSSPRCVRWRRLILPAHALESASGCYASGSRRFGKASCHRCDANRVVGGWPLAQIVGRYLWWYPWSALFNLILRLIWCPFRWSLYAQPYLLYESRHLSTMTFDDSHARWNWAFLGFIPRH